MPSFVDSIWNDIEGRARRLKPARPRTPARLKIASFLGLGVFAMLVLALLPLTSLPDAAKPQILIFPPWTDESEAFSALVARDWLPIAPGPAMPFGLTSFLAAPSPDSQDAGGFSIQALLSIGCLAAPTEFY